MAEPTSHLRSAIRGLTRGAIGFAAGFIVACFVLAFIGALPPNPRRDLSVAEIEQQDHALWLAVSIACGVAFLSVMTGRVLLSRFWLWFIFAFSVILVIPFWRDKGGSLLPFGTPYVDYGFQTADAIILVVHVSVALAVAAMIHWGWPVLRHRRREQPIDCSRAEDRIGPEVK